MRERPRRSCNYPGTGEAVAFMHQKQSGHGECYCRGLFQLSRRINGDYFDQNFAQ